MPTSFPCPVYGHPSLGSRPYENLPDPPFGDLGDPPYDARFGAYSHEGCHSCGYQFGFDDDPGASDRAIPFHVYRKSWVEGGCKWYMGPEKDPRPKRWSVKVQFRKAGIPYP